MRILVDGMPRTIGGIGTLLINVINYNEQIGNRLKYQFEFLVPENSAYISVLKKKQYCYYEVPKFYTCRYRKVIKDILKNGKYDYIWINNTSKVNIFLPMMAKKNNCKVILHSHGVACEETGIKKLMYHICEKIFEKKYCEYIDIPFACSKQSADYFYPLKFVNECKIIHNGILVTKYKYNEKIRMQVRKDLGISDSSVLLGTVGRLTRVKNYSFLITLAENLPINYQIIIIGKGEDETILREEIEEKRVTEKIKLLGEKENIEDYLSAMDVFLMPSLNEGLPFALVEAQASGLRCIVSDGISKETNLNGKVSYLKLNQPERWIDEIIACDKNNAERSLDGILIERKGYSIEKSYRTIIECLNS